VFSIWSMVWNMKHNGYIFMYLILCFHIKYDSVSANKPALHLANSKSETQAGNWLSWLWCHVLSTDTVPGQRIGIAALYDPSSCYGGIAPVLTFGTICRRGVNIMPWLLYPPVSTGMGNWVKPTAGLIHSLVTIPIELSGVYCIRIIL
jgi:hypothetical protein